MYAHQSISSVHGLGSKLFDRPSYCGDFVAFNEANSSIQGLRIHTFLKGPKGGVRLTSCNFWLQQQLRHEVDVDFHVLADLCTVVVLLNSGDSKDAQ